LIFNCRPDLFSPSHHDFSHSLAAARNTVNSLKEDVLLSQRLVKEKETQALIAQQKNDYAKHVLNQEIQNFILNQQKLAKVRDSFFISFSTFS
jgi:hypothetical protein